jgi:hypothetical protein
MNGTMYIPISASALNTAAELARQCSAISVRERVLVSQVVALAVREHLHRTAGLQADTGRCASLKYIELLDICDFNANDWRVEMRVITHVECLALYVPTMPLMVGVLSDFYVGARVEKDLTGAEMLGYARCPDLAEAELSANGLFALLPLEELQPFEALPEQLQKTRAFDARQEHAFEVWQARADRIMRAVSEVLTREGAFEPDQIGRLATGLRDDILSVYGEQLPKTGLEPLFEGVSRDLCNFFSHWYSLAEQDHKLIERRLPVANRVGPLFGHLLQRQIQHLHQRLIIREAPARFEPLP